LSLLFLNHRTTIASAACFLFIEQSLLLGISVNYLAALLIFSLSLAAYLFPQHKISGQSSYLSISFFIVSLFTSIWLLNEVDFKNFWPILCMVNLLFFTYRFNFIFGFSWRNHPATKGPAISLAWCLLTLGSVVAFQGEISDLKLLGFLFGSNFSFVLALSWLCDVADKKQDVHHGLKTIANELGDQKTFFWAIAIALVNTFIVILVGTKYEGLLLSSLLALVAVGLSCIIVNRMPSLSAKWLVDSLLLTKPLMVIWMIA
jgi:4-hydroxybenzoate polyprenyltransferase